LEGLLGDSEWHKHPPRCSMYAVVSRPQASRITANIAGLHSHCVPPRSRQTPRLFERSMLHRTWQAITIHIAAGPVSTHHTQSLPFESPLRDQQHTRLGSSSWQVHEPFNEDSSAVLMNPHSRGLVVCSIHTIIVVRLVGRYKI